MSKKSLATTLAKMQEYQEVLKQKELVEEYQNKRKTRRLLIGIYGTITLLMPILTFGLATAINLPCGVAATVVLGIPLAKSKIHVDKLKQELQYMEKRNPNIKRHCKEDYEKLEQKAINNLIRRSPKDERCELITRSPIPLYANKNQQPENSLDTQSYTTENENSTAKQDGRSLVKSIRH